MPLQCLCSALSAWSRHVTSRHVPILQRVPVSQMVYPGVSSPVQDGAWLPLFKYFKFTVFDTYTFLSCIVCLRQSHMHQSHGEFGLNHWQSDRHEHLKELQQDSLKQSNPLERNPLFLMFSVWLSQCMQALALFRLWLPVAPSKVLQRCAILWSQILVKVLCFHPGSCLMEQFHHSFAMSLQWIWTCCSSFLVPTCSNTDICRICRTCRICRMDAWLRSLH